MHEFDESRLEVIQSLRNLDMDDIYFLILCLHGYTLTQAAKALGLCAPSLTARRNKIKKHVGDFVFDNSRLGSYLTPEGKRLASILAITVRDFETEIMESKRVLIEDKGDIVRPSRHTLPHLLSK